MIVFHLVVVTVLHVVLLGVALPFVIYLLLIVLLLVILEANFANYLTALSKIRGGTVLFKIFYSSQIVLSKILRNVGLEFREMSSKSNISTKYKISQIWPKNFAKIQFLINEILCDHPTMTQP